MTIALDRITTTAARGHQKPDPEYGCSGFRQKARSDMVPTNGSQGGPS
jgi:hypothetical protein